MGWSEDVHNHQVAQSVGTARRERQLKRKGVPVSVSPNSGPFAFIVAAGAAAGFVAYRLYEKQLRGINWRENPVIKQFSLLLTGSGFTGKSSVTRPKSRSGKVVASGKPKSTTKPASSTSTAQSPSEAAGAAAVQRATEAAKPNAVNVEEEEEAEEEEAEAPAASTAAGMKKKKKKKTKAATGL